MDLFENISPENQEELLLFLEANTATFPKDQAIFSTLKKDNIIGIIVYGNLHIVKTDYNGNTTIIEKLEDDDIFGSIFSNISSNEYQLITKSETKIIVIDYDLILIKAQKNLLYFQFIQNLLKVTIDKIAEKDERIEILTEKTIRNKLLKYFQIISRKNGSRTIYLPFSLTELAKYLSIDRSAMMRELSYLKDEGLIETKGSRIYLTY